MKSLFILLLSLWLDFKVYGPGALSYAPLEEVAERRVLNNWNLSADYTEYDLLVAPSNCDLLNKNGWLIVRDQILTVKVVDCEQAKHQGQMDAWGLLADTNRKDLVHEQAWLIIR